MKILFAASEVSPIVKIGGLGDVAGALPKALEKLGVDVDVIVPFYPVIDRHKFKIIKQLSIDVPFDGHTWEVGVYKTKLPGSQVDVLLLNEPRFLAGGGVNAFSSLKDEIERFTFFSRAVVEYVKAQFNIYDVVHCNDWHTGMITHILEEEIGEERPATLFTIHNISYQGEWGMDLVQELGLSISEHRILEWDLEDGNVNLMLEGIASSDMVNTVSPTYAKEVKFSDVGGGMSEILRGKGKRFVGILNGIDYEYYNPQIDPFLRLNYNTRTYKEGKKQNKIELQKELGLKIKNVPVVSIISRLDGKQKGLDILCEALPEMLKLEMQFVLLGKGDKKYEESFYKLAHLRKYHGKVSINLGFDEALSHRIYAASDIFLMPSRFEPCGLSQLISMKYGTLPVAHGVGGLKDTVKDDSTGFIFNVFSGNGLLRAVTKAYKLCGSKKWQEMVTKAMKKDYSWARSAEDYLDVYKKAIDYKEEVPVLENIGFKD